MNVLEKRAIAYLIDIGIFAALYSFIIKGCIKIDFELGNLGMLLIITIFLKDLTFGNARIGKKLMGLKIYDRFWHVPKKRVLILRGVYASYMFCFILLRIKVAGGDFMKLFDFERKTLGTRVIDKKVYEELETIAKEREGDFAINMTELYNAYLRDLFPRDLD